MHLKSFDLNTKLRKSTPQLNFTPIDRFSQSTARNRCNTQVRAMTWFAIHHLGSRDRRHLFRAFLTSDCKKGIHTQSHLYYKVFYYLFIPSCILEQNWFARDTYNATGICSSFPLTANRCATNGKSHLPPSPRRQRSSGLSHHFHHRQRFVVDKVRYALVALDARMVNP